MSRASVVMKNFFIVYLAYIALYRGLIPLPTVIYEQIVPVLPWWLLVACGAYALGTLGYDVLSFNDKKDKYDELMEEIKVAKADLKAKGVDVE
ncbi:putative dolichol-phosphate mannosyltransferase subunit [Nadsonia fulvescens var. elongata DSM 6958]|uniref:Dolichol-phosphate mannosyltransferase subunit 3 n=1 Tax=Nadsonia fulvescens var. elongata DSM 6958 TaxID=857566 RepID=A0A1E3PFY6_9ASCO|nr:putative dolichol-phosphate mannosyltransferase subunit [Nadsonia fulvescens var. elongata DSM 6958]